MGVQQQYNSVITKCNNFLWRVSRANVADVLSSELLRIYYALRCKGRKRRDK